MFKVQNPGKKIKTILADLGSKYEIKVVDAEQCIYRDLQNGFDIEVSGLNNQKKSFNANIYIWQTKNGTQIVEKALNITSFEVLKERLEELSVKYS